MSAKWPELPVEYDPMGTCIWDANGSKVLDLRGWGRLTGQGCGGLKMPHDEAAEIQDAFGERLAALINGGKDV